MRERLEPFRRHIWSWAIPLVLVLVNLAWMSAFGSGARLRAADLEKRLERARVDHESSDRRLVELERLWITATENRQSVETLYREKFATEGERLTSMIREVKDLATRSGLEPASISYPEELIEEFGLVRRSFAFSVDGTYSDLRAFLHLLELTPTFVTVEQIRVGERSGGGLGINLRLSTLFARRPESSSGGAPAAANGGDS